MAYREENGQVVLTMSREDYDQLIKMVATATVHFWPDTIWILALLNRLNEGNPDWRPYRIPATA